MSDNYLKGRTAEFIAAKYVKKLGYSVLDRNFTFKRYEIDIVARDGNCIVFVEVRSRCKNALCSGYFSVNKKKKLNIKIASRAYLTSLKNRELAHRFDIIEISWLKDIKFNRFVANRLTLGLFCKYIQKHYALSHFENITIRP